MTGKYPLQSWANSCSDSSLTGSGCGASLALAAPSVSSTRWGAMLPMHIRTIQQVSPPSAGVDIGVRLPDESLGVVANDDDPFGLSIDSAESVLQDEDREIRGRERGWRMWQTSSRGHCVLTIAPRQVRQPTRMFGSEMKQTTCISFLVNHIIHMCVYHLFVCNNVGTIGYRSINTNKNKLSDWLTGTECVNHNINITFGEPG